MGRAPAQTVLFKDSSLQVEWGVATKEADLSMKTTSVFEGEPGGGDQGADGANASAFPSRVMCRKSLLRALARAAWRQRFFPCLLAVSGIAVGPSGAADPAKASAPQLDSPFSASPFAETAATPEPLRQLAAGGYALYLRHGPTNNAIPDRTPGVDLQD